MAKFRKKPVVIDAVQWHEFCGRGDHPAVEKFLDTPEGVMRRTNANANAWGNLAETFPGIQTLEGVMRVTPGDWIITGIKGEHYPCKPDIFAATYEAVEP